MVQNSKFIVHCSKTLSVDLAVFRNVIAGVARDLGCSLVRGVVFFSSTWRGRLVLWRTSLLLLGIEMVLRGATRWSADLFGTPSDFTAMKGRDGQGPQVALCSIATGGLQNVSLFPPVER